MKLNKLSLRVHIFLAMILLVLIASVLIAAVTIYQYKEEARDYHKQRLERKEKAIISDISYVIRETPEGVTTAKIPLIFKGEINRISDIHNLSLNMFDLEGALLISSNTSITRDTLLPHIDADVLKEISNSAAHRYVVKNVKNILGDGIKKITNDEIKARAKLWIDKK